MDITVCGVDQRTHRIEDAVSAIESLSSLKKIPHRVEINGEYHRAMVLIDLASYKEFYNLFWEVYTDIRGDKIFYHDSSFSISMGFYMSVIAGYINDNITNRDVLMSNIESKLKSIKKEKFSKFQLNIVIECSYNVEGWLERIPSSVTEKVASYSAKTAGFYSNYIFTEYKVGDFILYISDNTVIQDEMKRFIEKMKTRSEKNTNSVILSIIAPYPCLNCFEYGYWREHSYENDVGVNVEYPGDQSGKCANCQLMFVENGTTANEFQKKCLDSISKNYGNGMIKTLIATFFPKDLDSGEDADCENFD